jgi:hypothetical protein
MTDEIGTLAFRQLLPLYSFLIADIARGKRAELVTCRLSLACNDLVGLVP